MVPERWKSFYQELRRDYSEECLLNEPLASYTSYKVGGPADVLMHPQTISQLQAIIQQCHRLGIPWMVLGKGANVLIADEGFRGVVVMLDRCCRQIRKEENHLYVGSGVEVAQLVQYCERHGVGGLEFLAGIPGTIGGALIMNAGAFGGEIGQRVVYVEALLPTGKRIRIPKEDAGFGYRQAKGLQGKILMGCLLEVTPANGEELQKIHQHYVQRRAAKQPLQFPSCGSVFKRPPGDYAGRLIEAAGCKGWRVGGAMVSEKHANFIVNTGKATARDIFDLMVKVQQAVHEKFGIWLEPEVRLVGFPAHLRQKIQEPVHANP